VNKDYSYNPDAGTCTFEDGTVYTVREMIYLAKQNMSEADLDAMHAVKKMFDARIDTRPKKSFPSRALLTPFAPNDELTAMGRKLHKLKPIKRKDGRL